MKQRIRNHNDLLEKLKDNKHIIPLEEYINRGTKIKFRCLIHNIEFYSIPKYMVKSKGCRYCKIEAMKKTKKENNIKKPILSNQEFLKRLFKTCKTILPLEKYKGVGKKIKCRCIVCNYTWKIEPCRLYKINKCPSCNRKERGKEIFNNKIKKIENIISLRAYNTMNTKMRFKCLKCNYEWEQSTTYVINKKRCPNCERIQSIGEEKIASYLLNKRINFKRQKRFKECKNIRSLPFDFHIKEYNFCIEYDGEQHFRDSCWGNIDNTNDIIKNKFCKKNSIPLLRIPYWHKEDISELLNLVFSEMEAA